MKQVHSNGIKPQVKNLKTELVKKVQDMTKLRQQLKEIKLQKRQLKKQIAQFEWEETFQGLRMRLPVPLPSQGYREVIWTKIKNIWRNEGLIALIKKGILYGVILLAGS